MKSTLLLATASLALLLPTVTHGARETTRTLAFGDPGRPGTVKVQLAQGDLRIEGADVAAVTLKTQAQPATKAPRKDGLRVLSAPTGFAFTEKDNVITLAAGNESGGADFTLVVPRRTALVVENAGAGSVACADHAGRIEIRIAQGSVTLERISGGATVATMNGEIRAAIARVVADQPLSFTSMNGAIQVRVPEDAQADLRLQTQNGAILTDFDEAVLVTKLEPARSVSRRSSSSPGASSHTVLPPETHEAIREAARAAVQATRDAVQAAREAIEAAREGVEAGERSAAPRAPAAPVFGGGKLVTGALNGGGPEISIVTVNGDVTLRKISANGATVVK